ncbi:MAG TPA: methyltransferase domain-containing protein [Planctomycetota bacterium]|jgi:tRNA (guanine-N7-)-methyltransferase|nr:methyltransferase domain-containing protein [Planctomycetota bacterium]
MPFDWERVFGRVAPRVIDVGCGSGRFVIEAAAANPARDYLGIESVASLVEQALRDAIRRGLPNARFVAADAAGWLAAEAAPGSIDEIHVYHPQPYYDPGQVPLELLSPEFFERARTLLRPDGLLVLQTDNRRYGKHLLEAVAICFEAEVQDGPWPDAPLGRTQREIVARRKGLPILRILARRRERPLDRPAPAPYFDPSRPGLRTRRPNRKKAASRQASGGHAIIE